MKKKYKSEPLKCWTRAKEIRNDIYRDIVTAKEQGKLLVGGSTGGMLTLPSGFDYAYMGGEPYGATVAFLYNTDPVLYQQIVEASEHAGYPRDLCAYMRNYIGSVLLNKYAFGGPFPKLDFCLQTCACDTHAKWYQAVSEVEGIPLYCVEWIPYDWDESGESEKTRRLKIDYLTNQSLEAIDWMIKITGREYDDEKLIQAVLNECESATLWTKACMLNRAIPAPLDEKTMYSLYILPVLARHKKEVVEFHKELLDEVEYRVENRIAANPYERCRVITESQPPWHTLGIFRALESYGAVSVGAHYSFSLAGGWEYREEGDSWYPARTPQERGIELKTREDAVRTLAEWWTISNPASSMIRHNGAGRNKRVLDIVHKWHVDGVIVHLNRGCEGMAMAEMETYRALVAAGVPTLTYEGNMADPREFDEPRTLARIESFMETLGLKKIID